MNKTLLTTEKDKQVLPHPGFRDDHVFPINPYVSSYFEGVNLCYILGCMTGSEPPAGTPGVGTPRLDDTLRARGVENTVTFSAKIPVNVTNEFNSKFWEFYMKGEDGRNGLSVADAAAAAQRYVNSKPYLVAGITAQNKGARPSFVVVNGVRIAD